MLNTLPSAMPDEAVADIIAQSEADASGPAEMTGAPRSPQVEVSLSQELPAVST